LDGVQSRV